MSEIFNQINPLKEQQLWKHYLDISLRSKRSVNIRK